MTEDGLHGRFSHAPSNQLRCQAVSEGVRRDLALDPELCAELGDDVLHRPGADRLARVARLVPSAERRKDAGTTDLVTTRIPVRDEHPRGLLVEMDGPALSALRPVDAGGAILQIDIPSTQRAQLRNAHARPVH